MDIKKSIKYSIEQQLTKLESEERRLNAVYSDRTRVANDSYYAGIARNKARGEAENARQKLDTIINRKLELLNELQVL